MRKYQVNEKFFDELNEKSVYWLGFLYADGYVRVKDGKSGELKLKLKDSDKNHIEKFLIDIESNKDIKCGVDNKSKFCSVSIYSNYLVKRLFELGCMNNKTQKIRLPNMSPNSINHFIRGYFDGDGCIYKTKNKINTFSISIVSNDKFIHDLMNFMNMGSILKYPNYSILKISKINDIKLFRDFIYKNAETLLERKKMIFELINDNYKRDYSETKNKKKYKIISPDNKVIVCNHLSKFCLENNLVYSTMSNLSRGIGRVNKGWKCELLVD